MSKYNDLEKVAEKKYSQRDKKKSPPKMKVSGKSVFALQKLIKKNDSSSKRTSLKKNR